jgi:hypothetical protein
MALYTLVKYKGRYHNNCMLLLSTDNSSCTSPCTVRTNLIIKEKMTLEYKFDSGLQYPKTVTVSLFDFTTQDINSMGGAYEIASSIIRLLENVMKVEDSFDEELVCSDSVNENFKVETRIKFHPQQNTVFLTITNKGQRVFSNLLEGSNSLYENSTSRLSRIEKSSESSSFIVLSPLVINQEDLNYSTNFNESEFSVTENISDLLQEDKSEENQFTVKGFLEELENKIPVEKEHLLLKSQDRTRGETTSKQKIIIDENDIEEKSTNDCNSNITPQGSGFSSHVDETKKHQYACEYRENLNQ